MPLSPCPNRLALVALAKVCNFVVRWSSMAIDGEDRFHVLAVDDSLVDRKLIERLLKSSSFQVTTVDSGSKALEFLALRDEQRNGSPTSTSPESHDVEVNLIITDYCMPGMTGYDLLKRVKESASFKDIPVVIMSSENVPSRIDRCLAEGAEEFFLKPVKLFDISRLRPHIMKAKAKERQGQDQVEQQPEQQPEQQQEQQQPNNKRKAADDGIVQEKRKQRFNGLTVV